MNEELIFNFKTNISTVTFPSKLNNPFASTIPKIAQIAAQEFQEFIASESQKWKYDFQQQKGKMFGVLVVQKKDTTYGYLGTISGVLSRSEECEKFVPSIFDNSTDDFFINKGMAELTQLGDKIKLADNEAEIKLLKEKRKLKSLDLQRQLFENSKFSNLSMDVKNVLQIFEDSSHGNPPSAAGECAAPKLLQHAFNHDLTPIAILEFWWGNAPKNKERKHKGFYPACKNKCRPILEFMLNDYGLFNQINRVKKPVV